MCRPLFSLVVSLRLRARARPSSAPFICPRRSHEAINSSRARARALATRTCITRRGARMILETEKNETTNQHHKFYLHMCIVYIYWCSSIIYYIYRDTESCCVCMRTHTHMRWRDRVLRVHREKRDKTYARGAVVHGPRTLEASHTQKNKFKRFVWFMCACARTTHTHVHHAHAHHAHTRKHTHVPLT